jgi:hypothetical protein
VKVWAGVVLAGCLMAVGWSLFVSTIALRGDPTHLIPRELWLEHELRFQVDRYFELIGTFGWNDTPSPVLVYAVWTLLLVAAGVVVAVRGTAAVRLAFVAVLVLLVGLPAATDAIGIGEVSFVWQGRYGLPLAMGLPVLVLIALTTGPPPRRFDPTAMTRVLVLTLVVAQAAAFYWTLVRYVAGRPGSWSAFAGPWSPPGGSVTVLLLLAAGAGALAWWAGWSTGPSAQPAATAVPPGAAIRADHRAATSDHDHRPSTHSRPAAPMRAASARSRSSSTSLSAIATGDRPSTTKPVSPWSTASGAPPEEPATTGSPDADASR